MRKPHVLIKGGGDIASGIGYVLTMMGVGVIMAELPRPTMVRRRVSFGNAVYEGEVEVEGVTGVLCASAKEAFIATHSRRVAVVVDPVCRGIEFFRPGVLVDARLAKRNLGTKISDAPVIIGVGPGFVAGEDCHAVIESLRGPDLGRALYEGRAAADTGVPAKVMGHGTDRVLRAPCDGKFEASLNIGDKVSTGVKIGHVCPSPSSKGGRGSVVPSDVIAAIPGVLRGLIAEGIAVSAGQKIGDIDPSGVRKNCFVISDRALKVGDGVVEAVKRLAPHILDGAWPTSQGGEAGGGIGIDDLRRRLRGAPASGRA